MGGGADRIGRNLTPPPHSKMHFFEKKWGEKDEDEERNILPSGNIGEEEGAKSFATSLLFPHPCGFFPLEKKKLSEDASFLLPKLHKIS